MAVIMTMWMKGDPKKLESIAAEDPERLRGIAQRAQERGLIAHRFYGSGDGQIMVVDEWPDEQSFHDFFEAEAEQIRPLLEEVGVTSEPRSTFWRKIESHDEIGWSD
jgi:heme-degrading monooxygenase HmoA